MTSLVDLQGCFQSLRYRVPFTSTWYSVYNSVYVFTHSSECVSLLHTGRDMARGREGWACLVDQSSPSCPSQLVGGKGHNLWVLGSMEGCQVPDWFCITTDAFSTFIEVWGIQLYVSLYP